MRYTTFIDLDIIVYVDYSSGWSQIFLEKTDEVAYFTVQPTSSLV